MALRRNPGYNGLSSNYFSKAKLLEIVDKPERANVDPELITQYRNTRGKQVHLFASKKSEPNYKPVDKKKKKKKYLPAERLLMKLMNNESQSKYNDRKMKKVTDSIRRILDPNNDEAPE